MKKIRTVGILILLTFILTATPVFAQCDQGGGNSNQGGGNAPSGPYGIIIPNPLSNCANNIYDFIKAVVDNVVLPIGGTLAVFYIIYAGFLFVTARGDEAKLSEAKRALLYAAVGTAILLGAWVLADGMAATIKSITG